MSKDIVSLKIKVEDEGSFKKVSFDADEMRKIIEQVKNENDKLKNSLINNNQAVQAFQELGNAIRSIQGVMHGLTDAYGVQVSAETRLEQMMRNTMGATDEEIQSIKELAAEQQKLGVIGEEVILSGAQELATYMQKKESLEALIPVMNDMIAQQYGYNASAESAVGVAQMMGKVFAGEVGALKRLGYTFDETQEQVLKFGTEEEKVATLTEVVGGIVDGTNAKLASTNYGTLTQFSNKIGDIKEQLGGIVTPAMKAVDSLANFSIAAAGIGKGISLIKSAKVAVKGLNAAMKANVFIAVASAVASLVAVLVKLSNATSAAEKATKDFRDASKEARQKFEEESAEIQILISKIQDETTARIDQVEAIETLKSKYPDLVSQYINEKGHITDLIGLQKELNRLRTDEKHQGDSDKLDEYKKKLSDFEALKYATENNLPWANSVTNTPIQELTANRKWYESDKGYVNRQIKYWEKMVEHQQRVVDGNKKTEWKARLKDSTDEELEEMRARYDNFEEKYGYEMLDSDKKDLADINKEIALRKTAPPKQDKAYWENIRKQKQAELEALDTSELESPKAASLRNDISTATANIARFSNTATTPNPPKDDPYTIAVEAAEKQQRQRENDLKQQHLDQGGKMNKDEYDRQAETLAIEGLETQKAIALKYGKDTTKIEQQILDAKLQQSENNYERDSNALTQSLEEKKLTLTKQLAEREITEEQYTTQLKAAEQESYQKQLELQQQHGDDSIALQQQIAEAKIQQSNADFDNEADALLKNLDDTEMSLRISLINNVITQEQYDRAMLQAKARFYDDMLTLTRAYGKNDTQALRDLLNAQLELQQFDKQQVENGNSLDTFSKGWSGLKGIGSSIRDIKDALTETDNAWDALTQTIDGFLSLIQSVKQVVEVINAIKSAIQALQAVNDTATSKNLTNARKNIAANTGEAASGAAASVAETPYAGVILAVAAVGSVLAAMGSLPKFADGALVYGPTIGLIGEYGGASSNPEVISPLSRLRSLLGADGGTGRSEVKFRIEGRELVGIMNKQNNIYRRGH